MSTSHVITIQKKHLWIFGICIAAIVGVFFIVSNRDKEKAASAAGNKEDAQFSFADAVGTVAPDFSLKNIDGQVVNLQDLRGKTVVLFFNEGSMCFPACWNQVKELAADPQLNNDDVISYSVVVESAESWKQIMNKRPEYQTSNMLFDTTRDVSKMYDVLSLKSSMHKGAYPGHTYVVIDRDGYIRYVLDDPTMGINNSRLLTEIQKQS